MVKHTKNKILEAAMQLFMKFGFKRMTMDDLSKQLSISKKTIYKFFISKEDILECVFDWKKNQIHNKVQAILDNSKLNYMDKLNSIFEFMTKQISDFNVDFMTEIQFHNPELWKKLQEFKKESVFNLFNKMVDEGKKQGFVRDDIDQMVFVNMYYYTILNLMTPEFLATVSYSNKEVYQMIIKVYFEGILTIKGRNEFHIESLHKG